MAPSATQTIGRDSGASLRTIGSHAVKRTNTPKADQEKDVRFRQMLLREQTVQAMFRSAPRTLF